MEAGLFVARLNYAIANKPKPQHTADEELLALQQAIRVLRARPMMTGTRQRFAAHQKQTVSATKRLARSGGLSA